MTTTQPYGTTYGGSAPENYERYFVPVIPGPLAADLVEAAGLRPGERVLDVACGTGVVARRAAERVGARGAVAGVDVNASMLAVARAAPAPAEPRISWYETPAESMPLPDDSYDAVFCQLGLQFVEDTAAALREMRRVLAPGGRALVSVPRPSRFFGVLEEAFERHVPAGAPFVRMVFSLGDPADLERRVRGAGFRETVVRRETKTVRPPGPREFLWQYVGCTPLTGVLAGAGHEVLAALERDVVSGWQAWQRDGGMSYEQEMLVVIATK